MASNLLAISVHQKTAKTREALTAKTREALMLRLALFVSEWVRGDLLALRSPQQQLRIPHGLAANGAALALKSKKDTRIFNIISFNNIFPDGIKWSKKRKSKQISSIQSRFTKRRLPSIWQLRRHVWQTDYEVSCFMSF